MLFVGTQDGLASYRSAAGAWQRSEHTLVGYAIRAITATDAETLLVAIGDGQAQQSFDGGATWLPAPGAAPEPIGAQVATIHGPAPVANPRLSGATAYALVPGKPATLLGAGAGGMALFYSDDDGIHWKPAGVGDGSVGRIVALIPAVDARGAAWAGSDTGALLRSADRGRSWRVVAHEPAPILCLAAAE